MANIGGIECLVGRSVKLGLAVVAVDTLGIVLAVLTDTATLVVAVDVEGKVLLVDFRLVDALVRVTEAVTR